MNAATVGLVLKSTILLALVSGSCACVATTSNGQKKSVNVGGGGAVSDVSDRESPTEGERIVAPEEVEKAVLKFIGSVEKLSDFTSGRLRKLLGMPSRQVGPGEVSDEFVQDIPGTGWTQTLSFPGDAPSIDARLEYWLDNDKLRVDTATVDVQPICGMSYGAFRDELVSLKFLEGPQMPDPIAYESRGAMTHTFRRDFMVVDVHSQGRPKASVDASTTTNCILRIEVWMWSDDSSRTR
ncbi:hypothetical protein [Pseudomonas sp. CGJS7]|uniref:hypothetical protein n=1 Tax=Pseudomonas sp. CGJS7 TaxID=3109348 RepID=UPI003008B998